MGKIYVTYPKIKNYSNSLNQSKFENKEEDEEMESYCCLTCIQKNKIKIPVNLLDNMIYISNDGTIGKGFIFKDMENISKGPNMWVKLNSGDYNIHYVYCNNCNSYLGFRYVEAGETTAKFKEGMYLVEDLLVKKINI